MTLRAIWEVPMAPFIRGQCQACLGYHDPKDDYGQRLRECLKNRPKCRMQGCDQVTCIQAMTKDSSQPTCNVHYFGR